MSITYGGAIEKVLRYLAPRPVQQVRLNANYTAASGTMTLNGADPAAVAVRPGAVIEVGTNVLFVTAVSAVTNPVLTVVGGYQGSTDANASSGALVSVNPRFTRFDIAVAINDELLSLTAPDKGLGSVQTVQLTYIPTFDGYDLGSGFDSATSKVLQVSFKIVAPTKRHPPIRRGEYEVIRNNVDGDFPSGNGIVLSNSFNDTSIMGGDGWGSRAQPGFPITVIYAAPYVPLVNLTDDLTTVGLVQNTVQDIVVMGAELRLAADREIQRNTMGVQPDPRKATEVPAGAMKGATTSLELRYWKRISEEANRLFRQYPEMEWR